MKSWAVLAVYAILQLLYLVTGAVIGEVRPDSPPLMLTHMPMASTGYLTSTPMIPTHPRIPPTAPDPPGDSTTDWKSKILVGDIVGTHATAGRKEVFSIAEQSQPTNEPRFFLWEKFSESVIHEEERGGQSNANENTLESLAHSLETIETHVPTRVPIFYLPQASLATIRSTDGIQYTPRAEVTTVTPGTLSMPSNPMVTPLTPWVSGTPKTFWVESSPITPWSPVTPATQRKYTTLKPVATASNSKAKTHIFQSPLTFRSPSTTERTSSKEWWKDAEQITPINPEFLTTKTTTVSTQQTISSKNKISVLNPESPPKPTNQPSRLGNSKSLNEEKTLQGEILKPSSTPTSSKQSDKIYMRESSGIQDQRPFREFIKDINPQVARIWGGGNNEQLSALEEDLYRDSRSWPWLTGRRMRRKLSFETKISHPTERPLPVSLRSKVKKAFSLEGRKVLSAHDDMTSYNSKMSELRVNNSNMRANSSVDNTRVNIPSKSVSERMRFKVQHYGKSVDSQVDFKITKTGDYGGFSVTKTEEIGPIERKNISKVKTNLSMNIEAVPENESTNSKGEKHLTTGIFSKDPSEIENSGSVLPRVVEDSQIAANARDNSNDDDNITYVNLKREVQLKNIHSTFQPIVTRTPQNKEGKNIFHSLNVTSNVNSKFIYKSTLKPKLKVTHYISDRRSKMQVEPEPSKRHSSPFIINSKQLREYKDSHMPHRYTKSHTFKETSITHPKVFPAAISDSAKNATKENKINTLTTLSSVFKEDLIPPLPYRWGKEWHAQRPENSLRTPKTEVSSSNDSPNNKDPNAGSYPFQTQTDNIGNTNKQPSISSVKNVTQIKESVSSIGNMKFVGEQIDPWNGLPKYNVDHDIPHTTSTPNNKLDISMPATVPAIASDDLKKQRNSINVRETLGNGDLKGSSWPGVGEKVEFVTVVPGGQWDVWGGPPLWDPLNSNNSGYRSPQVYSVYWGEAGGPGSSAGWPKGVWVIRGGSLVAIMALVVTISVQVGRDSPAHKATTTADSMHRAQHNQHATLVTNLATSLASAHVLLIFGIQATGKAWVCGVVGLLLHFLHLVSCCWLLALTVRLLVALHQRKPIHTAVYCTASWSASLGLVVVSYVVNPDGYETRRYCWMSVERGMLVSFIVPVCTLILVNAGVCVATQKVLLDMRDGVKNEVMSQHKRDLRGAVSLLPLEGISWFLAVVALEDQQSLALDCAAALVSICLGWLVLYFHGWSFPCHGFCWIRRQIASSRRVGDLSLPLTARYDHDLAQQPLIPAQAGTSAGTTTAAAAASPSSSAAQPSHTTVTLAPPPAATTSHQSPQQEEFPLQPIFPLHERREAY